MNANTSTAIAGMTRMARAGSITALSPFAAELVERAHVHGVEALADAKHEHTEHDEGDQDRERDQNLDHQRHAFGAGRGQHQAVFQRHEADDLRHRVAPGDHHQQAEQDDSERERQILAHQHADILADRHDQQDRQRDETEPGQHRRSGADHLLDLAVDAEPAHDPVQRRRDEDALDHQRDRRGHQQMRRILDQDCQATDSDSAIACSANTLSTAVMRSW